MGGDPVYTPVAVAGAPRAWFCLDPAAGDPVAAWLLEHDWIDEPVQRLFVDLVQPGDRVVDLGCHLGTFALAAAAKGAEVIAVDATTRHVELVRLAAERNGFESLRAVHGAVADTDGAVDFVERGIHGYLRQPGDPVDETVTVPTVTVDSLVSEAGWETVDVVKMDVEGCEAAALRGMAELLATGCRPVFVFECNAPMLALQGSSVEELRRQLEELGYRLFLLDFRQAGTLYPTDARAVQPESASDCLAVVDSAEIPERWSMQPPLSLEHTVARVLEQAASPAAGYRLHAARVLSGGPEWLRTHPVASAGRAALAADLDGAVCAAATDPGQPIGQAAPRPASALPEEVVVFAEGLSLHTRPPELEHLPEFEARAEQELLARDLSFHVRRGELVGVLVAESGGGPRLLRVLAGIERPAAGRLDVRGRVTLLAGFDGLLEPELTLAENAGMVVAYLGGDVAQVAPQLGQICARAGIDADLRLPLGASSVEIAVRLLLAAALETVSTDLLLVEELPYVADETFRAWVAQRLRERIERGLAVVTLAHAPGAWLARPDRLAWIDDGTLVMCGHPESVVDAMSRRRYGFPRPRVAAALA